MARRPLLEVDGVKFDNVYEVKYKLYTAKDETGRPSDRAHAGVIEILKESDENTDLARWAMDSSQTNWKAGKVTFRDPKTEDVMKELEFQEGFITEYEEVIPHIKDRPGDQVFEHFKISCHVLKVGDAEIDNRWRE